MPIDWKTTVERPACPGAAGRPPDEDSRGRTGRAGRAHRGSLAMPHRRPRPPFGVLRLWRPRPPGPSVEGPKEVAMSTVDRAARPPAGRSGSRTEDRVAIGLGIAGLPRRRRRARASTRPRGTSLWSAGFACCSSRSWRPRGRGPCPRPASRRAPTSVAAGLVVDLLRRRVGAPLPPPSPRSSRPGPRLRGLRHRRPRAAPGRQVLPVRGAALLGGMFVLAFVLGELLIGQASEEAGQTADAPLRWARRGRLSCGGGWGI